MTQESFSNIHHPRTVDTGRGMAWLTEGFNYFQKDAMAWLGATILLLIISFALAVLPLIGALAGQILMPVFIGGLMLGCRIRAQGGAFQAMHLFAGFGPHTGRLMLLGVLYMAGILAIVILTVILVVVTGAGNPAILAGLEAADIAALGEHFKFVLLIALVIAALYVPLLMAYWFAPALVILHNAGPVNAMKLSFMGCLQNIIPFLLYGAIGLILSIIAIVPLGLGLLVLFPVVTASIYVACQDIYPGP